MMHDDARSDDEPVPPVTDADAARIAALARAAYPPPPAAPRDEMWAAISRARAVAATSGPTRRRLAGGWVLTGAAAAALLLGVALGRLTSAGSETRTVPTAAAGRLERDAAEPPAGAGDAYRVAALQHLAQTEVLLTEYRLRTRGETPRGDLRPWARELLGTTRLLIDSPAAGDGRMRALLEDLELVLAQIVQHAAAGARGSDDDFTRRMLDERGLLPKIRAAVPAGALTSGS